jgi:hypothetical protein
MQWFFVYLFLLAQYLLYIYIQLLGFLGDLEACHETLVTARKVLTKTEHKDLGLFILAQIIGILCWWERERGDISKAKELQEELLSIAKQLNSDILLGTAYGYIGAYYSQTGDITKALANYRHSRQLREKIGDEIRALRIASSMSWDIMAAGKPDEAIPFLKEIHKKYEALVGESNIPSNIIRFLGEILLLNGKLEESFEYIKNAYDRTVESSGDNSYATNVARKSMIDIHIEKNDLAQAKILLDKLKSYLTESPTDFLYAGYHYCYSNYHLKKNNLGLALEHTQKALDYASKPGNYDILLKTQLLFTKIYLEKYKLSENQSTLLPALTYVDNVIQATTEQNYLFLHWRTMIIKADILFLQKRFSASLDTLNEALALVKDDDQAKKIVQKNISEMNAKIAQERKLIDKESFLNRLSRNIQEAFKFIFVKKPDVIDYEIHGLLVIQGSGLPLYSKILNEKIIENDIMLTGLITAINSFSTKVFTGTKTGALSSIVHENLVILLEKKNDLLLALLANKNTFELRNRMMQFVNNLPKISSETIEQNKYDDLFESRFQKFFLE